MRRKLEAELSSRTRGEKKIIKLEVKTSGRVEVKEGGIGTAVLLNGDLYERKKDGWGTCLMD